jgi:lipoyl(octanoyl) transferase
MACDMGFDAANDIGDEPVPRIAMPITLDVRQLGLAEYESTWHAMQAFSARRTANTPDEIWVCQHPPVFTLGQAGLAEHLLHDIGVPLVKIDRGGQITYHGPGQLVVYLLIDLSRRGIKVREFVRRIEQALIDLLAGYGIVASRQSGAPGVYVDQAKIAALGLRIRNSCSYHGLCLNVDMDLAPYAAINPCGYSGLAVTQLSDLCPMPEARDLAQVAQRLLHHLEVQLS